MTASPFDFAYPLETIECRHVDGTARSFAVRVEAEQTGDVKTWSYYVQPIAPPDDSGEHYFACVEQVKPGLVQVIGLRNYLPERYRRCGITRTLIPVISRHLSVSVCSSKTRPRDRSSSDARVQEMDEMRSEQATRVWQLMVSHGLARYDEADDRFYYDKRE